MFAAHLVVHPWEVARPPALALLDQLRLDVGITGLTVALAEPAGWRSLVPQSDATPWHHAGGLVFEPGAGWYRETSINPAAAACLAEEVAGVAALLASATDRRLPLRLAISATAVGGLAERYPQLACVNALGLRSTRALCLAQPEVQAFVVGLAGDLRSRCPGATLVVQDLAIGCGEAGEAARWPIGWCDPLQRTGLALCCCGACQAAAEQAGVDASHVVERVRERLGRPAATAGALDEASLRTRWPEVAAYRDVQADIVRSVVERLQTGAPGELLLQQPAGDLAGPTATLAAADDPEAADPPVIALLPDAVLRGVEALPSCVPPARELGVPVRWALGEGNPLAPLAEAGWKGVQLESLSQLSPGQFDTLRQALRFARRSAERKT